MASEQRTRLKIRKDLIERFDTTVSGMSESDAHCCETLAFRPGSLS
ncbi:hypothetical protein [Thioclava dalianensis]|nr:hypothetical protein [Thioclava dalianensis]